MGVSTMGDVLIAFDRQIELNNRESDKCKLALAIVLFGVGPMLTGTLGTGETPV